MLISGIIFLFVVLFFAFIVPLMIRVQVKNEDDCKRFLDTFNSELKVKDWTKDFLRFMLLRIIL